MRIDFNKVEIKDLAGSDNVAVVKNGAITINLLALPSLDFYVSKITEKRIKIEK
jgi:hypothetical protein